MTTAVESDVRPSRPSDLAELPAIELAAAGMLVGFAPERVLLETTPMSDLEKAHRSGLLWVALADDRPVGFAHVKRLEPGSVHLDELDVHPDHARRGLGRRLVSGVCYWAAMNGVQAATLSTFRDPPCNRPFYESLGFESVRDSDLTDAMSAVVADEVRRGLDPLKRVVMRRQLGR